MPTVLASRMSRCCLRHRDEHFTSMLRWAPVHFVVLGGLSIHSKKKRLQIKGNRSVCLCVCVRLLCLRPSRLLYIMRMALTCWHTQITMRVYYIYTYTKAFVWWPGPVSRQGAKHIRRAASANDSNDSDDDVAGVHGNRLIWVTNFRLYAICRPRSVGWPAWPANKKRASSSSSLRPFDK